MALKSREARIVKMADVISNLRAIAEPAVKAGGSSVKRTAWGQWGVIHVVTLVFPLIVLLMAAGIAEKQLILAIVLVVTSFACSIARIFVSEQQQRQAALELEERSALLRAVFEGGGMPFM